MPAVTAPVAVAVAERTLSKEVPSGEWQPQWQWQPLQPEPEVSAVTARWQLSWTRAARAAWQLSWTRGSAELGPPETPSVRASPAAAAAACWRLVWAGGSGGSGAWIGAASHRADVGVQ